MRAGDRGAALTEFWNQARLARSTLHANQRLSFYVDPREGHDDLLISVALAVEAAQHSRPRLALGRRSQTPSPSGRGWGEGVFPATRARYQEGTNNFIAPMPAGAA